MDDIDLQRRKPMAKRKTLPKPRPNPTPCCPWRPPLTQQPLLPPSTPCWPAAIARKQFADLVGQEAISPGAGQRPREPSRRPCLPVHRRPRRRQDLARPASWPSASTAKKARPPTPCGSCDICRAIAAGEDVDVLEIDGASNRGIDEIRDLRSNVQYRPSRGRLQDLHHR